MLYGSLEAGGTKFRCAIGSLETGIIAQCRIPTTSPSETLAAVSRYFAETGKIHGSIKALGVACFGPIDINKASAKYGRLLKTSKPGWSNVNIAGILAGSLSLPLAITTDVIGAAKGEAYAGNARGLASFAYVTIGTGIGGAVVSEGRFANGKLHPELGHMFVPRHPEDAGFAGVCPIHGNCIEGLASGPAMANRWKVDASHLPVNHKAWEMEAYYLALLCTNITAAASPERIILGGGVMQKAGLLEQVRSVTAGFWADYIPLPENYLVAPGLENDSALTGGFLLAQEAFSPDR